MPHIKLPLVERGAVVDLALATSARDTQALRQAGLNVPPAVQLAGVIDTGTFSTVIDSQFIDQLGLSRVGKMAVQAMGHTEPLDCEQYQVSLSILHASLPRGVRRIAKSLRVLTADLQHTTGDEALLGQDILSRCRFVYDGPKKIFSLEF